MRELSGVDSRKKLMTSSMETIRTPRSDGKQGFVNVRLEVQHVDTFGRALTRGIIRHQGENWIVVCRGDWYLDIRVRDIRKGGGEHLKYRNYLKRRGLDTQGTKIKD